MNYTLLPIEIRLLSVSHQPVRQSYLPSMPKLTVVIYRKRLFIKSEPDQYQFTRIFLFAMFMKAYSEQSQLLNQIKTIIYGEYLKQADHQIKIMLMRKLNNVPFNEGVETQNGVLKLFDQETDNNIIEPFLRCMEKQNVKHFKLSECKDWFEQKFGQNIKILENFEENQNDICFMIDGQKILYESQRGVQMMQGVSLSSNIPTNSQLCLTSLSKMNSKKSNDIMQLTILKPSANSYEASDSSPTRKLIHKFSAGSNCSTPSPSPFEYQQAQNKKVQNKRFNIWDYFCC